MKLEIMEDKDLHEEKILLQCWEYTPRWQRMTRIFRGLAKRFVCHMGGQTHYLPMDEIYYLESVDAMGFVYTHNEVFACEQTLTALEAQLPASIFVRISKHCIVNILQLQSVSPYPNHRLLATLANGENILISRRYIADLKEKLMLIKEEIP